MSGTIWGRAAGLCRTLIDATRRVIGMNAELRDEVQPTPLKLRWLNLCFAALTIGAGLLAYDEGLRQKMHRVAPDAIEMLAQTIAVDISQRYHGTRGYVGRSEVLQTLLDGGVTGRQNLIDKFGLTYPENGERPELIEKAIKDALALKDLPEATFGNQKLFAPDANDPGFVDYLSLSFDLFGFQVSAFFYFYFLVFGISVALFLLCYHADALPLLVLSIAVVALLTLLDSQLFTNVNLRTIHNQRFLGSLCLVPYLHLLFTFLVYRRPSWTRVVVTVLQAALLTLLMFARSSSFWMILSLVAIAGVNAYFRLGRSYVETRLKRLATFAFSWPSFLVIGGLVCSLAYKTVTLHPIYNLDIYIPYHMVWHNAYMGLGVHPEWKERGDKHKGKPIPDALTDNMAWMGAVAEGDERYGITEAYLNNNVIGGFPAPRIRLHEQLIRDRFLRFVLHNPRFALEVYLWYKPKMFFQELLWAFEGYRWSLGTMLCQVALLALGASAWRLLAIPDDVRKTLSTALIVTGVMSLIPVVWTYPLRHVVGEQFLIWIAIVLYFATFLLSEAWSRVRPLVPRHA
ncbi:hypothetical protein RSO01_11710 [Reyranella soli]|uniref:Glycosyltransferase RgtA/B/C/D-like domain-containing protein n=2 Tax=Reyranella soli TaxID=1230389 RepID=A0A512N4U5_9HYPH|nr:hypothetical protein RSO01_11710 [Reyranella soli]